MPLTVCCNKAGDTEPPDGVGQWELVESKDLDGESSYLFNNLDPTDIHIYNIDFQGQIVNGNDSELVSIILANDTGNNNYYCESSLITGDPNITGIPLIKSKGDGLIVADTIEDAGSHSFMFNGYITAVEGDRFSYQSNVSMVSFLQRVAHHVTGYGEWFALGTSLTSILITTDGQSTFTGRLRLFKQTHTAFVNLKVGGLTGWIHRIFNLKFR